MRLLLWMVLFCCSPGYSQTLILPTDVDLKAAYCTPVYRSRLDAMSSFDGSGNSPVAAEIVKNYRESVQSDMRRTQLYLLPRLAYLSPDSLLAAAKGGEEDLAALSRTASACKCETIECLGNCPSGPETARLKTCDGASFLPF